MPGTASHGKPTLEEIREALERSGYLLEARIARVLRERQPPWFVQSNTRYRDPATGNSREIDLIASQHQSLGRGDKLVPGVHTFGATIHIECINNPLPLVLIRSGETVYNHQLDGLLEGALTHVRVEDAPIGRSVRLSELHHLRGSVLATQFCDLARKQNGPNKNQLMAAHSERAHSCLESLAQSMVINSMSSETASREVSNLRVRYGCAVLQGELYVLDMTTQGEYTIAASDHGAYRMVLVDRENGHRSEHLIDVVTENYFPEYLGLIEATSDGMLARVEPHLEAVVAFVNASPSLLERYKPLKQQ